MATLSSRQIIRKINKLVQDYELDKRKPASKHMVLIKNYETLISFQAASQPEWCPNDYWEWYAQQIQQNKRSSHFLGRKPKRNEMIECSTPANKSKEQKFDLSELNDTINETLGNSSEGSPYKYDEPKSHDPMKNKHFHFKRHGMDFGPLAGVKQRYPGLSNEAIFHFRVFEIFENDDAQKSGLDTDPQLWVPKFLHT